MISATSERLEELLDCMDEGGLISQLVSCEESSLVSLCERLCAVEDMRASGEEGVDAGLALACVGALLEELGRCGDPVGCAVRQLSSLTDAGQRVQALSVVAALPRVVLEVTCDAEVVCVGVVLGMLGKDGGGSFGERTAAAVALFALCMRNTTMPEDIETLVDSVRRSATDWVAATPDDIEAASALFAASQLLVQLFND
eukprot:COSAG02_NODE_24159_length_696_cov_1.085427_1_plen_199_part_10